MKFSMQGPYWGWRSLPRAGRNSAGFSQLELLITLAIAGTLSLILAPSWLGLMDSQALNQAQDGVFQTMREAQDQAKANRMSWQASFRNDPQGLQMAVHPVNALPHQITWRSFSAGAQIDPVNTTLYQSNGVYRVQFGYRGDIRGQLGRLTVQRGDRAARRCVFTSSLIGHLRKANNRDCNR